MARSKQYADDQSTPLQCCTITASCTHRRWRRWTSATAASPLPHPGQTTPPEVHWSGIARRRTCMRGQLSAAREMSSWATFAAGSSVICALWGTITVVVQLRVCRVLEQQRVGAFRSISSAAYVPSKPRTQFNPLVPIRYGFPPRPRLGRLLLDGEER